VSRSRAAVLLLLAPLGASAGEPSGPLHVRTDALPIANDTLLGDDGQNLGFGNTTAGDHRPDGWAHAFDKGSVTVERADNKGAAVARVVIAPGSQGTLCSRQVPVVPGKTLLLTSAMRGEMDLGDVTALHLKILGEKGEVYTARRRFDTGDHGWEPVEIRATAPPGATSATLCLDVHMVNGTTGGALQLAPLKLVSLEAESRSAKLPLQHVILVTVETFRWDHLHRAGYARATSPRLDEMAAQGAWFGRNQAQAPYTHPSLASIVSSRYPTSLGFGDNAPPDMRTDLRTAAEIFADAGYVTAAFNVQYVLSNRYGLNRGFHYYRNYPNDGTAEALNREAFRWLTAHAADNTFLWLHYFDPHGPYRPPERFRSIFDEDSLWKGDRTRLSPSPNAAEGVPFIPNYVYDNGQTERRHYVAGYDGDLAYTDEQIGKLLDLVRQNGWDKDTLVVVTGDHGESMTDHDRYFCHGSLYQHDLHVPLLAWAPGRITPGRDVETHTGNIDILPTLLDYAGVPRDPGLEGESLRPLVEGTRPALQRPFTVSMVGKLDRKFYAAIDDSDYKVVLDGGWHLTNAYNLVKDPLENDNLLGLAPKDARNMAVRAGQWLSELVKAAPAPTTQTLDAEDLERLKSMGYVE
jgi:arylsulfatase A-like enzyme